MKKLILFILACLSIVLLVGCEVSNQNGKVSVVTSTTMLGDLVKQIGQEKVDVHMLFSPGMDPHAATPTGGDTRRIEAARLVVFNGLNLEVHFNQILNAYEDKVLVIGTYIDEDLLIYHETNEGLEVDPHIWFSVPLWKVAAQVVGDRLSLIDPENKAYYEQNTLAYIKQLDSLHNWIIEQLGSLDVDNRMLVTAHDAFSYFGQTYNMGIAAIEGLAPESETSIADINRIADVIIEYQVKSIFIESTIPQTTVEAVKAEVLRRGHTVLIGKSLYADALGVGIEAEYIEAMKVNVINIVEGLS